MLRVVSLVILWILILDIIHAIQHGEYADIEDFPFLGSLWVPQMQITQRCSSFLVRWNTALTAAHCLANNLGDTPVVIIPVETSSVYVVMGVSNWADLDNPSFQKRKAVKLIWHPKAAFNIPGPLSSRFDIGAIILETPFEPIRTVGVIDLVPNSRQYVQKFIKEASTCLIAGWGSTNVSISKNAPYPRRLRFAPFKLIGKGKCCHDLMDPLDFQYCITTLGYLKSGCGCFSRIANGTSIGRKDSGSPIVCNEKGVHYVVGLSVAGMYNYDETINGEEDVLNPGFRILESVMREFIRSIAGHPEGTGGRTAIEITDYPYVGSLSTLWDSEEKEKHMCNVIFVHRKAVITAAHCLILDLCVWPLEIIPYEKSHYWISGGANDVTRHYESNEQTAMVVNVKLHPRNNLNNTQPFYNEFDIGAIITDVPFILTDTLQLVTIPTPSEVEYITQNIMPEEHNECDMISWAATVNVYVGDITGGLSDPGSATRLEVNLIERETCCRIFFPSLQTACSEYFNTRAHRCHVFNVGREAFLGDSGAPLICYYKSKQAVLGMHVGEYPDVRCSTNSRCPVGDQCSDRFCREYKTPAVHISYDLMKWYITNEVLTMKEIVEFSSQPRGISSRIVILATTIALIKIQ